MRCRPRRSAYSASSSVSPAGPGQLIQDVLARANGPVFFPQKLHQFREIGRPEFDGNHAPLKFLRNEADGEVMDYELPLIETVLVNIPKAATNLRGLAQRLMEILEVENAGVLVRER